MKLRISIALVACWACGVPDERGVVTAALDAGMGPDQVLDGVYVIDRPAQINLAALVPVCAGGAGFTVTVTDPSGAAVASSGAVSFVPVVPGTHVLEVQCWGARVATVQAVAVRALRATPAQIGMIDSLDGESGGQTTLRGTLVFGEFGWVSGNVIWNRYLGKITRAIDHGGTLQSVPRDSLDVTGFVGMPQRLVGSEDEVYLLGSTGIARIRIVQGGWVRGPDVPVPAAYATHDRYRMTTKLLPDGTLLLTMPEDGTICRLPPSGKPRCAQVPGHVLGADATGFWAIRDAVPVTLPGLHFVGGTLCHLALEADGSTHGPCSAVPKGWEGRGWTTPHLVVPMFNTTMPQAPPMTGTVTTTHHSHQALIPREVDAAIELTVIDVATLESIVDVGEQSMVTDTGYPSYVFRAYTWR